MGIFDKSKELLEATRQGDAEKVKRLLKRLDEARAEFHRLYNYTPLPQEEAHARLR